MALGLLLCAPCWAAEPASAAETPAQKAQRMQWWADARFGMFIHFGPVSLKGTEIGWSRGKEVPVEVYDNLYKQFNPVKFNAQQYVSLAKEAGMKYIVLVTKHHDGFAMYATKLSGCNIMNTPLRRDLTGELADECRRQGVRFCAYYSIIDWNHLDYLPRGPGDKRPTKGAHFENYMAFMKGQVREIVANYHPGVLWFDGQWDNLWTADRGREVYTMLRQLDPQIIVNNRLGTNFSAAQGGLTPPETTVGDFHTPEQMTGHFLRDRNVYWESCMTLGRQWAWKPHDQLKSLEECVDLLVTNAGSDGNFLLNVGPMPSGEIEPRQADRLREIGRWMKQYGESIYGTRGGPFRPAMWGVSTCKGDTIFVHVLHWPGEGPIRLPAVGKKIVASRLLGGGSVDVKQEDAGVTVAVPAAGRQPLDTVIALKLDGTATDVPIAGEQTNGRRTDFLIRPRFGTD